MNDGLESAEKRIEVKIKEAKEKQSKGLLTKEQEAELESLERMFKFAKGLIE